MKNRSKQLILGLFLWGTSMANAQVIANLKVKTPANEKDRTMMLDILRATMYPEFKQELIYKVNHFKMGGGYAYFVGEAFRKDGREIQLDEDNPHECCYVGALFVKKQDKWYLGESCIFPTDACNVGVSQRNPRAPKGIFDASALMKMEGEEN